MPAHQEDDRAWEQRYRQILGEIFAIIGQMSEEIDGFELLLEEYRHNPIAERMAIEKENLILECAIGCAMYYQLRFDLHLRFDIRYLRECIGHLRCFLAAHLIDDRFYVEGDAVHPEEFRDLKQITAYAEAYVERLQQWCGMEGDIE